MMPLKILDCTFRDGGYYNNWDFSRQTVLRYLKAIEGSGIDVIEIGFRFPKLNKYLGAHAYSTDAYLRTLPVPNDVDLAVMINAKDFVDRRLDSEEVIDNVFVNKADSPITMVRIAAHLKEVPDCQALVGRLKEKGYVVGLNLMQVGGCAKKHLEQLAKSIAGWGTVDVLAFADSLGNMDDVDICRTVKALQKYWKGPLGVHTHDNMGRALTNSLVAMDAGASWIDATIHGMGRGPGNARMEYLLVELMRRGVKSVQPDLIFPLVLKDFSELHSQFGWGSNLLYFLTGAYSVHPTYVQEMINLDNQSADNVISALEYLRDDGANSYDEDRLREAVTPTAVSYPGKWSAEGWAKGRSVLLVGTGPWLGEHVDQLVQYIDTTNPIVISLNTNTPLPGEKVSAFTACHPIRFAMEADQYNKLPAPLIAPIAAASDAVRSVIVPDIIFDYGMTVEANRFAANETYCVIPCRLASIYAMAIANAAGAKEILLAGFDGYHPSNPLQQEMEEAFAIYNSTPGTIPITAVTPTTYSITQSSLFVPSH
jgi:4-hydroxy 2-oxovalerate aldolase